MKKLGISLIYIITTILILTFLLTLFNYFNIINNTSILKISIPIISTFIGGLIIGIKTNKKGFIEGLKLGSIFILILLVLNIVVFQFKFKSLLYYLILITTTSLGSMIGINIKKSN